MSMLNAYFYGYYTLQGTVKRKAVSKIKELKIEELK